MDVTPLGSDHADHPIPAIVTIPRFCSGPGCAFAPPLGSLMLSVFSRNKQPCGPLSRRKSPLASVYAATAATRETSEVPAFGSPDERGAMLFGPSTMIKARPPMPDMIGCSTPFGRGPDCILSRLPVVWTGHRRPTTVQSLTAFHRLDVAPVGSDHADCPILAIFTIPRLHSGPERAFATLLGRQGSQGVPATSSLAVSKRNH